MLFVALVVAASALQVELFNENSQFLESEYQTMYTHYLKEYNKNYDDAERQKRFDIFQTNLNTIQAHNAANHTWKMGFGPFTDLTADEFYAQAVGGCYMEARPDSERNVEILEATGPFDDIDWTTKSCGSGACVTPVKNQASCGSCWAFSSTGEIEARVAIKTDKAVVSLSEQQLVDCSKKEGNHGCNGGLMDDAFKYVEQSGGLCTEESYPYTAKTGTTCKASSCGGMNDAITSYKDVARNQEAQLGAALQAGPVSVAIQANKAIFQHYKNGVISGKCCGGMVKERCQLDHGVLLVGDVNGAWKVKNSWGASWGDKGFVMMAKGHEKEGECGIAMEPSYVIV